MRVIYLMSLDEGCACGGNHVNHIKDIGQIKSPELKTQEKHSESATKLYI